MMYLASHEHNKTPVGVVIARNQTGGRHSGPTPVIGGDQTKQYISAQRDMTSSLVYPAEHSPPADANASVEDELFIAEWPVSAVGSLDLHLLRSLPLYCALEKLHRRVIFISTPIGNRRVK
jgi:hypothetical protein